MKGLAWVLVFGPLLGACGGGEENAGGPAPPSTPSETPGDDYTNFVLDYRDDAVVIDDLRSVQQALVRADYENGELVFTPDFAGVESLETGKAAVIAGIGIFHVTGRESTAEGELVRVEDAALTDVLENASISWRRSFVSAYADSRLGLGIDEDEAESIGKLREGIGTYQDGKLHYSGSLSDFATTFDIDPTTAGLDFTLTAKLEAGENALINAALNGTLSGLTQEVTIDVLDGSLKSYTEHYYGVKGKVNFHAGGVQLSKKVRLSIPARLSLPVMIGPIPFHVDLGTSLDVESTLGGSTSAIVKGSTNFSGGLAIDVHPEGNVDYHAAFDTADLVLEDAEQVATITCGYDIVLNFPQISVGIGVPKVAEASSFLRVKTESITNATVMYEAAGPYPVISDVCLEASTNLGASYGGNATMLGLNLFEDEHPIFGKVGEKKRSDGCK